MRHQWGLNAVLAGLAVAAGYFAMTLDSRWTLVMVAYALAGVVGFALGRRGLAWVSAGALVAAVVVAPRMVMLPSEVITFETGNAKPIAVLAVTVLGAGVALARTPRERVLVTVPGALVFGGALFNPSLTLEPGLAWLAASGALFLVGREWRTLRWPLIVAGLLGGVVSMVLLIPGVGAPNAIQYEHLGRPYGVYGNPIIASDATMFLGAAALALCWRSRLARVVLAGAAFCGVILSGSRTGLLLLIMLALAAILGRFPRARSAKVEPGRVLAASVGVGIVAAALLYFQDQLGRAASLTQDPQSFTARLAGLEAGLAGVFATPFGGDRVNIRFAGGYIQTYENLFLDVGSRLGLLPLFGLLVALIMAWRLAAPPARVSLLMLIVAGGTAAIYYQPAALVLGFICAGVVDSVARESVQTSAVVGAGRSPHSTRSPSPSPTECEPPKTARR